MWFLFALITTLAWGTADLFYKCGAEERDRYSHLRTAIAVGVVMGVHAVYELLFGGFFYDPVNLLIYLPVSLMYILSMTVGYFGLRYLELSISSPIQNASGAVVCLMCLVFLGQTMNGLSAFGVVLICGGVIALGIFERRLLVLTEEEKNDKVHTIGFAAFLMPVLYCLLDSLGTFFDAFMLDDFTKTPLRGVTEESFETVANVSYELTFLITAVLLAVYLFLIRRQPVVPPREKGGAAKTGFRFGAALFETLGQFTYVFAMSGSGVVAAPMIGAYCAVSVILSRIFLREKLTGKQYLTVAVVIAGILLLGLSDALSA